MTVPLRLLSAAAALAVAATVISCGEVVYLAEPVIPHDGVAMLAQPEYALWWGLTEACSGRRGDMAEYRWFVMPRVSAVDAQGDRAYTNPIEHRIVVAGAWVSDGGVIRHEMLHALGAYPGHPEEDFQQKCGGIVDCPGKCLSDGGSLPAVDSSGPIVRPQDLDVTSYVTPSAPSSVQDSGWFALVVQIQNRTSHAVRVRLASVDGNNDAAATFGFRSLKCTTSTPLSGSYYFVWDTVLVLGAGQAQRQMFDLRTESLCLRYIPFFNDDSLASFQIPATP